ncbi:MAG: DsbA family oxidoreductase [Candidatus Saccharibacteria bacterium]
MQEKMKVEIWSDVMCPYCYIGKHKFESALKEIDQKELIEVEWKSFQLNPSLQYQPGVNSYDYLAKIKGKSREWSVMVHNNLASMAKSFGLDYRFDQTKITNSFDAHRVIQLSKKYGRSNELEELLFKAYFTDGELISDHATLIRLAAEAGLPEEEVAAALKTNLYSEEVHQDMAEARRLGTNGVPFFVFDRKYAIVGAQDSGVFIDALEKTLEGRED